MCGICGIVDRKRGANAWRADLEAMSALLKRRGRDGHGTWFGGAAALGHRRLAITDIDAGQQPMSNEDKSIWVVFNGEIYNYRALRGQLERRGHEFRTASDTEVIPHMYEEYGEEFVSHLEGNWAIGLWDDRASTLLLSRDRLGKRPIAWAVTNGVIRFASEPKAILASPQVGREPSCRGLVDVITYGFVTETNTMFEGVHSVLPATTLTFGPGSNAPMARRYWDFASVPRYRHSLAQARADFTDILAEASRQRLMGDVPLALMLSGGIDSSLVGSFLAEHQPNLRAFTVARGDAYDEVQSARRVAEHVGLEHHVIPLGSIDPVAVGARIPWMFDQPFFNDATFANCAMASAISSDITVAITGDGGDESFSGTMRHAGERIAGVIASAPRPALSTVLRGSSAAMHLGRARPTIRRAHQLMRVSRVEPDRRWLSLHQQNLPIHAPWTLGPAITEALRGYDAEAAAVQYYHSSGASEHLNRVLYAEIKFQLPPNDLVKVDRTFLHNGVEGRAPLLDRRVVEFAARLPAAWKQKGFTYKYFLRKLAGERLPPEIAQARKIGLAVPFREWLRADLGLRAGAVLASSSFRQRGIFDQDAALRALAEHRRRTRDWGYILWTMAMVEIWHRTFIDQFGEPDARVWE
jgi:asparagine synthase (glutamine-hydrolysing)